MKREEVLRSFYESYPEDARLASGYGRVEFLTTVSYIERYLQSGMRLLEIGAGTGCYSHYFAKQGYTVDAIELVEHNIRIFESKICPQEHITIRQGDALDLSCIPSDTYDMTLLLGPMYHLYTKEDQHRALSEALRVTKEGGIVCAAYCGSDLTMYQYCFGRRMIKHALWDKKIVPDTFKLLSLPEDIFQLYRKEDIDELMRAFPVTRLHYVGTDMLTHMMRDAIQALDEEEFEHYMAYHMSICERTDMIGASNHILDIFRKNRGKDRKGCV